MAKSREYFALDWIKSELLETLNTARVGLEAHADALEAGIAPQDTEAGGNPLRECVNALHQVHGTLVMLELKGVTLLADHLERLASALLSGEVEDVAAVSQNLMQGILELPGHLDELQAGAPDTEGSVLALVNELRAHLREPALTAQGTGVDLFGVASDAALKRFNDIRGTDKTRKIRAAYQQVLLALLKGGELSRAIDSLRKVAHGMARVCDGTPFQAQWQAFGEFVESLPGGAGEAGGPLDSSAVKVLRRVDSEIREIARSGAEALKRPPTINLVRQLLDAAAARGRRSALLDELGAAVARSGPTETMTLSGRQALVSAATALREELGTVKDRLDLFVRGGSRAPADLHDLLAPLKQIASTLSLLGFESSKSMVLEQVDVLAALTEQEQCDEAAILNVAGALVQVDENLAGLTQGGKGEAELITDDAQRAVARQARDGLDQVKQSIVDFVSSQWDVRHLEDAPAQLESIAGALRMIPLAQAADLVQRCRDYVSADLMAGHAPGWEELDRLADGLSGIDYYLERLASDSPGGADDVLELAERSMSSLGGRRDKAQHGEVAAAAPAADEAPAASNVPAPEERQQAGADSAHTDPLFGAAQNVDVRAVGEGEEEEPALEMEADPDFDLSSAMFDELAGDAAPADSERSPEEPVPEPEDTESGFEVEAQAEPEEADELQIEPVPEPSADSASGGRAAGSYVPASLADSFDSDADIVEIFAEEVDEVLETVDGHLGPWASALDDETHQTEVRRAFHTLKGSGRMVGANVLGEMAWSVENMLNRVIDGTVPLTPEFVAVVRQARELVPLLRDSFERKATPDMTAVGGIMEQADVLASGGALADTDAAEDRMLFVDEAAGLVRELGAMLKGDGAVLDDGALRALHTLSGSAAIAGLDTLAELARPAYELAQALRRPGEDTRLDAEAAAFYHEVVGSLGAMVDALRTGGEPDEPFQLVAEADRMLAEAARPKPASTLMKLPALASLMKASQLLDGWEDGAVDLALAEELQGALAAIEDTARNEGVAVIAATAGALRRAHERFEFESLGGGDHVVFSRGHERLLAQFDALAADQTPPDGADLEAELDALTPQVPAEDEAFEDDAAEEELATLEPELPPARDEIEPPAEIALPVQLDAAEVEAAGDIDPEPVAESAAVLLDADVAGLLPEEVDADIIEVFFEEADELLEALDQGISDWSGEHDNRLHLENLLRALHTLKGGARLSGLTRLGDHTHDFESYLIAYQDSGRAADASLFDELNGWYDELAALVARIRGAVSGASPEGAAASAAAAPAPQRKPTPQPKPEAPKAPEPEATEALAPETATPEAAAPATPETPPRDLVRPLRPAARHPEREQADEAPATAQARAAQEMVRVGAGLLESLVNLAGESSIIRARVEQGMSDFTGALDEMETTIERLREQLRRLEIETETQVLFRRERLDGPDYEEFDPLEMDRYSQLQQLSRSLGESASDMLDLKETLLYKAREAETLLLQQARVNTELQEGLMRSRMVPFSRLLPRLKRTVRQVARELDKDVELHAFNIDGELDRTLLERMVPPLEHMLRNAVDHGIEQRAARREAGKAEAGRIDLRLSREGGDVVIEISDDGAGIDVARVRSKAIERGLMARDAKLRDDEISQFVLAPGFSTAASVTQISGRGVGMDVVHSEVKQLGGSIDILSQRGRGTRFVVRVPFTVSVNRALMVAVGEDLYAIPLNTIEGIVLLSHEELERLYAPDGNTFEYAGVPYRIQYLGSFLGREYHPQPQLGSVPVVLVRSGEHAVAVHVDGVQGSREIVVKSLGPQFAGVGGISGATILGDGSVVVILDLLALIRTRRSGDGARGRRMPSSGARTRCIMVVDDSVTVRKVTSRLLERQGMDVVVAKDGVEAISLLQERRPDVMLLDIEMPRMDGFEVLRQVRHDDQLRDLPIVMISSRTGTKHQDRAAELGVSRFLGKPFQESELLATIDELVN